MRFHTGDAARHESACRTREGESAMRMFLAVFLMLVASIGLAAPNAPSSPAAVRGEVLEVKDVDAYTYLRLKTKDGETWAAVNRAPIKKGAEVSIENPTVMTNFSSKTLNRTFDRIVFGSLAGAGTGAATAKTDLNAMHAGMSQPADIADVKVAKATGPDARTVAEIVGTKADLKGKTVLVRGKVVKYTPAVLGKNWIHLRDGSGSADAKTNDVLVTTKDETKIGDVVLVKGVVRTDVDLGSGYTYTVMVDEATLQK
jgi:hypothetical protein